jgi:serine beta-lactamase-like protein LACTB
MARGSAGDEASRFAEELHKACPAPALSLAVANGNGPLWSRAFGKADLEFDVTATPDHLFRLGSVSKVVTTVAAARLAMRGIIELDTPIAYWLPDLPEQHRATTLRQLLTHRGGIRHYNPGDLDHKGPGGPVTHRSYNGRDEIFALFVDDPLVASPGETVSYSSYGYTLASFVMEAAAGVEFTQLVWEEVAAPFGLATLMPDRVLDVVPLRARGYFSAQEIGFIWSKMPGAPPPKLTGDYANVLLSNPSFCWAGAGFLMSMPETAKFGAAMLEGAGSRITPEERALLFTPLTQKAENSPPLGLGWRVDEDGQGRLRWHHAGSTPGGRAGLVVYPELALSIALAGNTMTAPGDVLGPASELADIFG